LFDLKIRNSGQCLNRTKTKIVGKYLYFPKDFSFAKEFLYKIRTGIFRQITLCQSTFNNVNRKNLGALYQNRFTWKNLTFENVICRIPLF